MWDECENDILARVDHGLELIIRPVESSSSAKVWYQIIGLFEGQKEEDCFDVGSFDTPDEAKERGDRFFDSYLRVIKMILKHKII